MDIASYNYSKKEILNMDTKLNKIYKSLISKPEENKKKKKFIKEIQNYLNAHLDNRMFVIGSGGYDLALKESDFDVVCLTDPDLIKIFDLNFTNLEYEPQKSNNNTNGSQKTKKNLQLKKNKTLFHLDRYKHKGLAKNTQSCDYKSAKNSEMITLSNSCNLNNSNNINLQKTQSHFVSNIKKSKKSIQNPIKDSSNKISTKNKDKVENDILDSFTKKNQLKSGIKILHKLTNKNNDCCNPYDRERNEILDGKSNKNNDFQSLYNIEKDEKTIKKILNYVNNKNSDYLNFYIIKNDDRKEKIAGINNDSTNLYDIQYLKILNNNKFRIDCKKTEDNLKTTNFYEMNTTKKIEKICKFKSYSCDYEDRKIKWTENDSFDVISMHEHNCKYNSIYDNKSQIQKYFNFRQINKIKIDNISSDSTNLRHLETSISENSIDSANKDLNINENVKSIQKYNAKDKKNIKKLEKKNLYSEDNKNIIKSPNINQNSSTNRVVHKQYIIPNIKKLFLSKKKEEMPSREYFIPKTAVKNQNYYNLSYNKYLQSIKANNYNAFNAEKKQDISKKNISLTKCHLNSHISIYSTNIKNKKQLDCNNSFDLTSEENLNSFDSSKIPKIDNYKINNNSTDSSIIMYKKDFKKEKLYDINKIKLNNSLDLVTKKDAKTLQEHNKYDINANIRNLSLDLVYKNNKKKSTKKKKLKFENIQNKPIYDINNLNKKDILKSSKLDNTEKLNLTIKYSSILSKIQNMNSEKDEISSNYSNKYDSL